MALTLGIRSVPGLPPCVECGAAACLPCRACALLLCDTICAAAHAREEHRARPAIAARVERTVLVRRVTAVRRQTGRGSTVIAAALGMDVAPVRRVVRGLRRAEREGRTA